MIFNLFLKLIGIWLASWLVGCFVNTLNCYRSAGEYAGDCAIQTAFFSFIIIMPFFPVLYLPVMFGLRRLLGGVTPKVIFPIVSSVLFLIPIGWIYLSRSSSSEQWINALFNPGGEFHIVLFFTGLLFGLGFVSVLSKHDAQHAVSAKIDSWRILS